MMLYEPERKPEFRSIILYEPPDRRSELSAISTDTTIPTFPRGGYGVEVKENGAVVAFPSPYYYEKHMLDDQYDAHGVRQGTWEIGLCNLRACLPMTCCIFCGLPSIAVAQIRTRLRLATYRQALAKEFARLLIVVVCPIVAFVAIEQLQAIESNETTKRRLKDNPPPSLASNKTGKPPQDNAETGYMLLLWSACIALLAVLLFLLLLLSDMRHKIRSRYEIPGSRTGDFWRVLCLPTCAIAQMSTHVRCLRPGRYRVGCPETLPPYDY